MDRPHSIKTLFAMRQNMVGQWRVEYIETFLRDDGVERIHQSKTFNSPVAAKRFILKERTETDVWLQYAANNRLEVKRRETYAKKHKVIRKLRRLWAIRRPVRYIIQIVPQ